MLDARAFHGTLDVLGLGELVSCRSGVLIAQVWALDVSLPDKKTPSLVSYYSEPSL